MPQTDVDAEIEKMPEPMRTEYRRKLQNLRRNYEKYWRPASPLTAD